MAESESDTSLSYEATYGGASDTKYGSSRGLPDIPGDIKLTADGGASLTIGQEGFVELMASPMAKLILLNMMHLCRILCREFEVVTDFGTLKFSNGTNGRCGLVIEGGAAYGEESEPSAGVPTTRFFMGDIEDSPDMRLGFMVNATDNSGASGYFIGKDGKTRVATTDDYLISVGSDSQTLIQGDRLTQVDSNSIEEVHGKMENTVMGNVKETAGGEKAQQVAGNYNLEVGGILNINAAGINLQSMSTSGQPCTLRCSSLNIQTV